MKRLIALFLLSGVTVTTNANASECTKIAKTMSPYKGLVAEAKNVKMVWQKDKMESMTGWKYTWEYKFPGRPTYSSWTVAGDGKEANFKLKNGDAFFYVAVKNPEIKARYDKMKTVGYVPVFLTGKDCSYVQVDMSAQESEIVW